MEKDLIKENKALKASLAELAYWETQLNALTKDMQKIVDVWWDIEFNDWEEKANPEDHIFHSYNNIKNWLESQRRDNG